MKPFSLQTVLDYRKRLEDIAQYRLMEAKTIQETIQKKLNEELHALALFIDEIEKLQAEGIDITELMRFEERITARKSNIQAIRRNLTEKSALVKKEQQNLIDRSRERQIMDQLKDTQNKAWKVYLNKKEAAMLDEIATSRHEPDSF
ncbi:flagellar export protein FliJ [Desulfocastanea catecholica]